MEVYLTKKVDRVLTSNQKKFVKKTDIQIGSLQKDIYDFDCGTIEH